MTPPVLRGYRLAFVLFDVIDVHLRGDRLGFVLFNVVDVHAERNG